mgnify:CR=1 FL=1
MPMALIASMILKSPLAIERSFHGVPLMSRVTCLLAMMTTSKFTLDVHSIRNLLGNFAPKTVKNLSMSTLLIGAYNLCLKLTVLVVVQDSALIIKALVKVTMYVKGKTIKVAVFTSTNRIIIIILI